MPDQQASWPRVDEFIADQVAKGRKILGSMRQAAQASTVVVAEEFATIEEASARAKAMHDRCMGADYESSVADVGELYAIVVMGAGESFDVSAFMFMRDQERVGGLVSRVALLERQMAMDHHASKDHQTSKVGWIG